MSIYGFLAGGAMMGVGSWLVWQGVRPATLGERAGEVVQWNPPPPRELTPTQRDSVSNTARELNALRTMIRAEWAYLFRKQEEVRVTVGGQTHNVGAAKFGRLFADENAPWPEIQHATVSPTFRTEELGAYTSEVISGRIQTVIAKLDWILVAMGEENWPEVVTPARFNATYSNVKARFGVLRRMAQVWAIREGQWLRDQLTQQAQICAAHEIREHFEDGAELPIVGEATPDWFRGGVAWLYYQHPVWSRMTATQRRERELRQQPCRPARYLEVDA